MTATAGIRTTLDPASGSTAVGATIAGRRSLAERTEVAGVPAYLVCFLAFVPADMFSGNGRLIGFPISPDRLCLAAGLVLLVLDPRPWAVVRVRWRLVHAVLAAMVLFAIASAVAFDVWRTSLAQFALLDRLLIPFVLFTVAPVVFSGVRSRDLLLKVLVVLGLYLGVTAVFEVAGPTQLVLPRYIMDSSIGIQFGRARGPFVEAEADGLVMAVCGFAAGLAMTRFRGAWRLVSVAAAVACAVGVLFCLTRSVWIGTVLGMVVAGFAVRRLRLFLVPAAIVGALGVTALVDRVPGLADKVLGRAESQGPVYDRLNTNAAALRIVEARPLSGVGWSRFIDVAPDWVRQAPDYPITNIVLEVHNVFLGRAAELGLVGAVLFVVCVLLGPVAAVLRRAPAGDLTAWRVVALGALCTWLVAANTSPLPYPLPNALVWMVAGIASAGYIARPGPARMATSVEPLA